MNDNNKTSNSLTNPSTVDFAWAVYTSQHDITTVSPDQLFKDGWARAVNVAGVIRPETAAISGANGKRDLTTLEMALLMHALQPWRHYFTPWKRTRVKREVWEAVNKSLDEVRGGE